MPFCVKCGSSHEAAASFCGNCGQALTAAAPVSPQVVPAPAPVVPPSAQTETNRALELAPLSKRILGGIIDHLMIYVCGMVLSVMTLGMGMVLTLPLFIAYEVFFMSNKDYRGTLGMKAMGLEVCDLQGNRLPPEKALIRSLMSIASGLFLFAGYFFAFFNEKQQTLHDLVAGTVVINRKD
ncbi:Uncharacterized membrane protein YckC, RDD family [Formivibrio citricus]|uniref:Uncharacterized membrane protein YckC, RDD family n=1 Tax=Formivibrio citricus TaxID=83765 RepID=A0A1I5AWJ0_9NEIS|nr:RDD family protein [Formivibrio citricus]SFN66813.1 Uncharacterized membrane protein YckC, RDD family [Formivibrio citricus]